MMTRPLPIFLGLLLATTLSAQSPLTTAYFPEAGDSLRYSTNTSLEIDIDDLIDINGPNINIDFGDLSGTTDPVETVTAVLNDSDFPTAELRIDGFDGISSYYRTTDNAFILTGIEASISDFVPLDIGRLNVEYELDPERPMRRAGVDYGDRFVTTDVNSVAVNPDDVPQEIIDLLPDTLQPFITQVDSVRVRVVTDREITYDAYGQVTLNGVTYDVLRERMVESIQGFVEVKVGSFNYIDITPLLEPFVPEEIAPVLGTRPSLVTVTYWSNDSKEFILNYREIDEDPIDGADDVPALIRFKLETDRTSSVADAFIRQARVSVFPNPAATEATFSIEGAQAGNYELVLVNQLGRVMQRRDLRVEGGTTRASLNVGDLPRGLYLYSLRNEQGVVLTTKRLLVGTNRP